MSYERYCMAITVGEPVGKSGGMAGQGDGNQVCTDAVALFKGVKRFLKVDFGQIFDKAGALW